MLTSPDGSICIFLQMLLSFVPSIRIVPFCVVSPFVLEKIAPLLIPLPASDMLFIFMNDERKFSSFSVTRLGPVPSNPSPSSRNSVNLLPAASKYTPQFLESFPLTANDWAVRRALTMDFEAESTSVEFRYPPSHMKAPEESIAKMAMTKSISIKLKPDWLVFSIKYLVLSI